ncbi:MAG TPA: hypothetical protein VKR06_46160 [Ktedonosporobacter sp.]|nr:hypothetical protein [Ktedonosporobacter sp.]
MTEQQASMLKEQIAAEMPDVRAAITHSAHGGSARYGWALKLKNEKLNRSLRILNADQWEGVKEAWQA